MKSLIISESPRKNGDSMTLVNELIKRLDGEVEIIYTYYDNIKPCLDCRFLKVFRIYLFLVQVLLLQINKSSHPTRYNGGDTSGKSYKEEKLH